MATEQQNQIDPEVSLGLDALKNTLGAIGGYSAQVYNYTPTTGFGSGVGTINLGSSLINSGTAALEGDPEKALQEAGKLGAAFLSTETARDIIGHWAASIAPSMNNADISGTLQHGGAVLGALGTGANIYNELEKGGEHAATNATVAGLQGAADIGGSYFGPAGWVIGQGTGAVTSLTAEIMNPGANVPQVSTVAAGRTLMEKTGLNEAIVDKAFGRELMTDMAPIATRAAEVGGTFVGGIVGSDFVIKSDTFQDVFLTEALVKNPHANFDLVNRHTDLDITPTEVFNTLQDIKSEFSKDGRPTNDIEQAMTNVAREIGFTHEPKNRTPERGFDYQATVSNIESKVAEAGTFNGNPEAQQAFDQAMETLREAGHASYQMSPEGELVFQKTLASLEQSAGGVGAESMLRATKNVMTEGLPLQETLRMGSEMAPSNSEHSNYVAMVNDSVEALNESLDIQTSLTEKAFNVAAEIGLNILNSLEGGEKMRVSESDFGLKSPTESPNVAIDQKGAGIQVS